MTKFEELKNKSFKELVEMFNSNLKSLFLKKSAQLSGGSNKTHELRNLKKQNARIKTAITIISKKK